MMTKNLTLALSLKAIGYPVAYDSGSNGWKKDADGKLVVDDNGNPVYVDSNGRELALGADTVSRLNNEAKTHRERAEAAEATAKKFEGIDPTAARKALDTVSKIDQSKLIDAGKVDEVRAEITKNFDSQISERDATIADLRSKNQRTTLERAFESSKFVTDSLAVPVDMAQKFFGDSFVVDDNGNIKPVGKDGKEIYSPKRAGEVATFDEALQMLVEQYPNRDSILKGNSNQGSGGNSNGGSNGNQRRIKMSEFNAMAPVDQAAIATKAREGTVVLYD